jgi:PPOX class probable F420-dependent enzyme
MDRDSALGYIGANRRGVLVTLKRDGRPQISYVAYLLDDDGEVKISVTKDRAKTRNVLRDPRVSLSVVGPNWYEYVVVEGMGRIIEEGALPVLRRVYEGVSGKPHPDWADFDAAMVRDGRVVLSIAIERLYPLE